MRILLIGYGKMGKAIEQMALQRGHQIAHKIDLHNRAELATITLKTVDVALEFSQPETAYDNIYQCLSQNIPVIAGTTGWLARKEAIHAHCKAQQGTFFYASNFSIGMNIFFKVNAFLAKLMNQRSAYEMMLKEEHHIEKKDAPSGTAIMLAEDIIKNIDRKNRWALAPVEQKSVLEIVAKREKDLPGTHTVTYTSSLDTLMLQHIAHNRTAFSLGAVLVAEWIQDKIGVLGMEDFLELDT